MRAFLAAPANETTRQAFANVENDLIRRLGLSGDRHVRMTWVRPDVVHLTFKFLGDIEEAVAGPLEHAVGRALRGMGPVELPIDHLGVFPRADAPRALWIGPDESWSASDAATRLMAVHAAIEDVCDTAGFAREPGPWRPHLTLARVRSNERDVGRALRSIGALERALAIQPMPIDAVVLMKSELLPGGPTHAPVWMHRLASAGPVS
jgi:RNA 2',3'-cyclic 3'-phosphodiesterase